MRLLFLQHLSLSCQLTVSAEVAGWRTWMILTPFGGDLQQCMSLCPVALLTL